VSLTSHSKPCSHGSSALHVQVGLWTVGLQHLRIEQESWSKGDELVVPIECTMRCTVYVKRHRKIFQRGFSDNGAARWERVHWCAAPSDRVLWEKVDLWPCCLHIEDTRRAKDMLSQTSIICLLQNMRSNESLPPLSSSKEIVHDAWRNFIFSSTPGWMHGSQARKSWYWNNDWIQEARTCVPTSASHAAMRVSLYCRTHIMVAYMFYM
jgi:hypothetical protein